MSTIREYTTEEIQTYLDDFTPTYEPDLGSIDTCVRIIARYEPGRHERDAELQQQALDSILSFAADYGVQP